MRKSIYHKYLSLQIGFFDYPKNNPGLLLSKLSTETTKINGLALLILRNSVETMVMVIISIVLGFYYDWRLSLINLGFLLLIIFIYFMRFKIQRGYRKTDRHLEVEAPAILSVSVINSKTIFAYNI